MRFREIGKALLPFLLVSVLAAMAIGAEEQPDMESTSEVTGSSTSSALDGISLGSEFGKDFILERDNFYDNVSTFTGQFVYDLPIASLEGPHGSALTFSIHYSSAEARKKNSLTNRYYQASWVGTGWQGGFGYIASDGNNTTMVSDDEYYMVDETGVSHKLLRVPDSNDALFVVDRHKNWKITRYRSGENNVTGWLVQKEDGRKFTYGNADSLATRYSLACGGDAGDPIADPDAYQLRPYQWDLYEISDPQNRTQFTFSYQVDLAQLTNQLGTSDLSYTRSSYLKRITAADGRYLAFGVCSRKDYEAAKTSSQHDYYSTGALYAMETRSASDALVSKVSLQYSYLNPAKTNDLKKLALDSVTFCQDESQDLCQQYGFCYQQDPESDHFGAITQVSEPSGVVREIAYSNETSGSVSDLTMDDARTTFGWLDLDGADVDDIKSAFTDNIGITMCPGGVYVYDDGVQTDLDDSYRLFYWNGNWQGIHSGSASKIEAIGAGDGYAVVAYLDWNNNGRLKVYRLDDGYLRDSLLTCELSLDVESWGIKWAELTIDCGPDFFVLRRSASGTGGMQPDPYPYTSPDDIFDAVTYHWDGTQWVKALISPTVLDAAGTHEPDDERWFTDVAISGKSLIMKGHRLIPFTSSVRWDGLLIVGTWQDGQFRMKEIPQFSRSLTTTGDLIKGPATHFPYAAYVVKNENDEMAKLHIQEYREDESGGHWYEDEATGTIWGPGYDDLLAHTLVVKDNYIAQIAYCNERPRVYISNRTNGAWGAPEVFEVMDDSASPPAFADALIDVQYDDQTICILYKQDTAIHVNDRKLMRLFSWDGDEWRNQLMDFHYPPNAAMSFSSATIAVHTEGAHRIGDPSLDVVWVSRRVADGAYGLPWSTPVQVLNEAHTSTHSDVRAADNRIAYSWVSNGPSGAAAEVRLYEYERGAWDATTVLDYSENGLSMKPPLMHLSRNTLFFLHASTVSSLDRMAGRTRAWHSYMGQHTGIAAHTMVEAVTLKNGESDSDPRVVQYMYEDVTKDRTDNYPRAGKTTVFTPRFASQPEEEAHQTVYYHYNDYSTDELDLSDATTFGIEGGGYILDGALYKVEYENDIGGIGTTDWTTYSHKVDAITSPCAGVYRTYLDEEVSSLDQILTTTGYTYYGEPRCQLKTATTTYPGDGGDQSRANSTSYGWQSSSSMSAWNALSQPGEIVVKDVAADSVLTRTIFEYDGAAGFRVRDKKTWLDNPSEDIYEFQVTQFDDYGNVLDVENAAGTNTASLYGADNMRVVAQVEGSSSSEYLSQDFEQGDGWDGWDLRLTAYATLDASAFTGSNSYRLETATDNSKTWGATSTIQSVNLGDSNLYHFSCWVKGDADVHIYCYPEDGSGVNCVQPGWYGYKIFTGLSTTDWQLIEGTFDFAELYSTPIDVTDCVESAIIQLVTYSENAGSYALFDDFRIHPAGALMVTQTYDPLSMQISSQSDNNNVPTKHEYDGFQRLVATRNHTDDLVTTREYFLSTDNRTYLPFEKTFWGPTDEIPERVGMLRIDSAQEVSYEAHTYGDCSCWEYGGDRWSDSRFWLQFSYLDNPLVGIAFEECSSAADTSNSFQVADDFNVPVWYHGGCMGGGTPPTTYITFSYLAKQSEVDPGQPSYVKTTSYRSPDDSTEAITFYDHLGHPIQTRSTHALEDGQLVTTVQGTEYDARGRVSKEYKPYLDRDEDNSVYDFDVETSLQSELADYNADDTTYTTGPDLSLLLEGHLSESVVLPSDGFVRYSLRCIQFSGHETSYAQIFRGDDLVDEVHEPPTVRDVFWGTAGETVTVVAHFDNDYGEIARASFDHSGVIIPAEGADCAGRPYTAYDYEPGAIGRLTETFPPGDFWEHEIGLEYGTNSAAIQDYSAEDLYEQIVTNENGVRHAVYTNAVGHVIAEVGDLDGTPTQTIHYPDLLGRDTLIIQPAGQASPDNYEINRTYNNLGWVLSETSADFGTVSYVYDRLGNLRFRQDASDSVANRFKFLKYDEHNRLLQSGFLFESGTSLMTWANATDPSYPDETTTDSIVLISDYEYDEGSFGLGRLSKVTTGPRLFYVDTSSYEAFTYDIYGNVTEKEYYVFGCDVSRIPRAAQMEYNNLGQMTRLTYNNGKYVDYSYDLAGRVGSVVDNDNIFVARFDYNPTGQIKTKKLGPPGDTVEVVDYRYNARDWLLTINDGQASGLDAYDLELTYTDGAYEGVGGEFPSGYYNGNIASYDLDNGGPKTQQSFAYDNHDRLIAEDYDYLDQQTHNARYVYDANGNITAITDHLLNNKVTYQYNNTNLPVSITEGFMATDLETTPSGSISMYDRFSDLADMWMYYDLNERLYFKTMKSIYGTTRYNTQKFWYNHAGQRIRKEHKYWRRYTCDDGGDDPIIIDPIVLPRIAPNQVLGGLPSYCYETVPYTTGYYYLADNMLFDYSGNEETSLIGNYVYANGKRIGGFQDSVASAVMYYLDDHLGSVVTLIRGDGNYVSNRTSYRPFGEIIEEFVKTEDKYGYTAQPLDDELGNPWYYYGQRYYDPQFKIFTSVDPMWGRSPSWGPYVYTKQNPIKYIDPDGGYERNAVIELHPWIDGGRRIRPAGTYYRMNFTTRIDRCAEGFIGFTPIIGSIKALEEDIRGIEPIGLGDAVGAAGDVGFALRVAKPVGSVLTGLDFAVNGLGALDFAKHAYVDPDWFQDAWNVKYRGRVFTSESAFNEAVRSVIREHRQENYEEPVWTEDQARWNDYGIDPDHWERDLYPTGSSPTTGLKN